MDSVPRALGKSLLELYRQRKLTPKLMKSTIEEAEEILAEEEERRVARSAIGRMVRPILYPGDQRLSHYEFVDKLKSCLRDAVGAHLFFGGDGI